MFQIIVSHLMCVSMYFASNTSESALLSYHNIISLTEYVLKNSRSVLCIRCHLNLEMA